LRVTNIYTLEQDPAQVIVGLSLCNKMARIASPMPFSASIKKRLSIVNGEKLGLYVPSATLGPAQDSPQVDLILRTRRCPPSI